MSVARDVVSQLSALRVLPVLVIPEVAQAIPLADALTRGGLPVAEVTLRTPSAMESIRRISAERPDVTIGAGTVLSATQAREVIDLSITSQQGIVEDLRQLHSKQAALSEAVAR